MVLLYIILLSYRISFAFLKQSFFGINCGLKTIFYVLNFWDNFLYQNLEIQKSGNSKKRKRNLKALGSNRQGKRLFSTKKRRFHS